MHFPLVVCCPILPFFLLKFSALEIYNEVVNDLLNPESSPLRLLDDPEVSEMCFSVHKYVCMYACMYILTQRRITFLFFKAICEFNVHICGMCYDDCSL